MSNPIRPAAIVLCTLLALTWTPSHGNALPGQETGDVAKAVSPKPNPDASGKYHVGDGVSAPKLLFAVDPEFTDQARHKRVAGTVVVALTVDTAGNPQDVRVARSMSQDVDKKYKQIALGLDDNAVAAVKQYRYQAAQFQGKPVPVEVEVKVNFRIW
jgi:TonB family protein